MTKLSIDINELINRKIIRDDKIYEWMNKMSDDELIQRDEEIYEILRERGVEFKFPDLNSKYLSFNIDTDILYNMFKLGKL